MDIGTFAALRVKEVRNDGSILAWAGKSLFLPREEEVGKLQRGSVVVVFVGIDRNERPFASMKLQEFLQHDSGELSEGQRVELLVIAETDLGFKCIVDHEHLGMLYRSEVFQPLDYGSELPGYVKRIRPDGKVDLILQPEGHKGADELGRRILAKLELYGGFLDLTDKSDPDRIYDLFGVSKKKYKAAIGTLYKNRQIRILDNGIELSSSGE